MASISSMQATPGFVFFFNRFRRKIFEKYLQIFRKRGWFPGNARICHNDHTTHLSCLSCSKDPLRDLLGKIFLIPSRSSWGVLRFFCYCSTVWNIIAELSVVKCWTVKNSIFESTDWNDRSSMEIFYSYRDMFASKCKYCLCFLRFIVEY